MITTVLDSGSFWGAIAGLAAVILGGALSVAGRLGKLSQSIDDLRERHQSNNEAVNSALISIDRRLTYLEHRAWTTHPLSPGPVGPEPGPRPRPR